MKYLNRLGRVNLVVLITMVSIALIPQIKAKKKMEKITHVNVSKRGYTGQDYLRMQTYYSDLLKAITEDYGNCKIKGVEYNGVDTLTAGVVFLDGEFYTYNGKTPYNGTDEVYVTKSVTASTKPYLDGISRSYIEHYIAAPANQGDAGAIRIDNLRRWQIIKEDVRNIIYHTVAGQIPSTNTFEITDITAFPLVDGVTLDIEMQMDAGSRTNPWRGLNMSVGTGVDNIFRIKIGANYYKIYKRNGTDLVNADNAIVDGANEDGIRPIVRFRFVASLDGGAGGFIMRSILEESSGRFNGIAGSQGVIVFWISRQNGMVVFSLTYSFNTADSGGVNVKSLPYGYKPLTGLTIRAFEAVFSTPVACIEEFSVSTNGEIYLSSYPTANNFITFGCSYSIQLPY